MSAILANADVATYKKMSSFSSVEDFNLTVRCMLYRYKHQFTKADQAIFLILKRYAVKIIGVCFLKVDRLAELAEVSRSSAERAIRKFERLQLLIRYQTQRVNGTCKGGRGHNVYCFRRFDGAADRSILTDRSNETTSTPSTYQRHLPAAEALLTQTTSSNEKQVTPFDQSYELNEAFTPAFVPVEFKNTAAPFFRSADRIVELWTRAVWAHRKVKLERPLEEMVDIVCDVFRQTVYAKKRGWIKNSFYGYYYHILMGEFSIWRRREVALEKPLYNWLETK